MGSAPCPAAVRHTSLRLDARCPMSVDVQVVPATLASDATASLAMDHGSWIMDHGSWIVDRGSWIVDHGSWITDHAPGSRGGERPGMRRLPGDARARRPHGVARG